MCWTCMRGRPRSKSTKMWHSSRLSLQDLQALTRWSAPRDSVQRRMAVTGTHGRRHRRCSAGARERGSKCRRAPELLHRRTETRSKYRPYQYCQFLRVPGPSHWFVTLCATFGVSQPVGLQICGGAAVVHIGIFLGNGLFICVIVSVKIYPSSYRYRYTVQKTKTSHETSQRYRYTTQKSAHDAVTAGSSPSPQTIFHDVFVCKSGLGQAQSTCRFVFTICLSFSLD